MAEDKGSVTKAGASASSDVNQADLSESPTPTQGQVPVNEAVLTGNEDQLEASEVSADNSSKEDLQKEARARGLGDSGTKQELADRINEHDSEGVHKPEVLYPVEEE